MFNTTTSPLFSRRAPVRLAVPFGLAVVAAALLMSAGTAAAAPAHAASCTLVSGTFSGYVEPVYEAEELVGFHSVVTESTGNLGGSTSADLVIERITPAGAMRLSGAHHFVDTTVGSFETADHVWVGPQGAVHDSLLVTSGDATGFLVTDGTVDLTTGALFLEYRGRLCS
jgi:hypothetical protein